ncbi:hypothetical protein VUR80DRAFT_2 [Thermomyces stellatus]
MKAEVSAPRQTVPGHSHSCEMATSWVSVRPFGFIRSAVQQELNRPETNTWRDLVMSMPARMFGSRALFVCSRASRFPTRVRYPGSTRSPSPRVPRKRKLVWVRQRRRRFSGFGFSTPSLSGRRATASVPSGAIPSNPSASVAQHYAISVLFGPPEGLPDRWQLLAAAAGGDFQCARTVPGA